jgi:hypothetical protein
VATDATLGGALLARMDRPGPKRLLALDGGGIRGLITLEVLAEMESILRRKLGAGPGFVLADWFDYIAGTSTGAIIATALALGLRVSDIRNFYLTQGPSMFGRARLLHRLRYRFESEPLAEALRATFGATRTLGSAELRSLLMVMLHNVTTDSPWPLSNNPRARYNDRGLLDCNLDLPLWQIVRASTAAPTFFPPETVQVGPTRFVFMDGGVSPYNNPAFLLFLMATTEPYRLNWQASPEQLLLVSVGTGSVPNTQPALVPKMMNLLYLIGAVPKLLLFSALNHQDMLCRMFGEMLAGPPLDGETADTLRPGGGSGLPKLFTYVRYNAELTHGGLAALDLHGVQPSDVQPLDGVRQAEALTRIGRAVATQQVRADHFERHM